MWTNEQIQHVARCAKDPEYFLDTFCWIDADEGIMPFNIGHKQGEDFYYQREILRKFIAGENIVILKSRRAGLSWIAAAICAWGINFNRGWNALLVSRTEVEAISLLNKVKFILDNLAYKDSNDITTATPAGWLRNSIEIRSQKALAVGHRNDSGEVATLSMVRSSTTTKHAGRGEKTRFVFVDEVQFVDNQDDVFGAALTTAARNGQWMMGCVTEDTIVYTEDGVVPISKYVTRNNKSCFTDINPLKVYGKNGFQDAVKVYNSGYQDTIKITTDYNYKLECTRIHPLLVNRSGVLQWIVAADLHEGDWLPISRGMNVWGNNFNTKEFSFVPEKLGSYKPFSFPSDVDSAYLLGLIVGDGYVAHKNVVVASIDKETQDFLANLGFILEADNINNRICSRELVEFCKWSGINIDKKAPEKEIPFRIMEAPKHIVVAFLRGLFDTDGHSETKTGRVGFTTTSKTLVKQVRGLLLNLGIITALYNHNAPKRAIDGKRYVKESNGYRLTVDMDASKFYSLVGFRLSRKQENKNNVPKNLRLKDSVPFIAKQIEHVRKQLQYGHDREIKAKLRNSSTKRSASGMVSYVKLQEIVNELPHLSGTKGYDTIKEVVETNYLWVQVRGLEESSNYTVDFNIPNGHNYIANGFVSHNSNAGSVGTRFHHLCMMGRSKENKTFWYREVWPEETGIDTDTIERMSEAMPEDVINQEWYLAFRQPGNAVFDSVHLAACYKPPEMYPEVMATLENYRELVSNNRWEYYYFSGVDTAVGKAHRKSKDKDYHAWVSLTATGIQAYTYYSKKPLSFWAGENIQDDNGILSVKPGKTSELHEAFPGLAVIEEEGPGYTTLNRHITPLDGISGVRPVAMKHHIKKRIIRNLMIAIESHTLVITDEKTYQQMSMFQYGDTPDTFEAPLGFNDDLVMALAMALEGLRLEGGFELTFTNGASLDMLDLAPYNEIEKKALDLERAPVVAALQHELPLGARASFYLPSPFKDVPEPPNPAFLPNPSILEEL